MKKLWLLFSKLNSLCTNKHFRQNIFVFHNCFWDFEWSDSGWCSRKKFYVPRESSWAKIFFLDFFRTFSQKILADVLKLIFKFLEGHFGRFFVKRNKFLFSNFELAFFIGTLKILRGKKLAFVLIIDLKAFGRTFWAFFLWKEVLYFSNFEQEFRPLFSQPISTCSEDFFRKIIFEGKNIESFNLSGLWAKKFRQLFSKQFYVSGEKFWGKNENNFGIFVGIEPKRFGWCARYCFVRVQRMFVSNNFRLVFSKVDLHFRMNILGIYLLQFQFEDFLKIS